MIVGEQTARQVLDHLQNAVLVFDSDLRIELATGQTLRAAGWSPTEVEGRTVEEIVLGVPASRLRDVCRAALDGEEQFLEYRSPRDGRYYELRVKPLEGGRAVAVTTDVTERHEAEEKLRWAAGHDDVTGLANRRRFRAELERHVAFIRRHGTVGALLVLDLDGLKTVNDTSGHAAGDALLRGVAGAMRSRLRRSDLLARLGGDEFAVLVPDVDAEGTERVAEALRAAVAEFELVAGGRRIHATASIGATTTSGRLSGDELLAVADAAMYLAKGRGGDHTFVRADDRTEPGPEREVSIPPPPDLVAPPHAAIEQV